MSYWPKFSRAEGEAYYRLSDTMRKLEWEIHHKFWRGEGLPKEWHDLAIEKGAGEKERITIRIDKKVVKFFRATGSGWQTRMNLVLEAYALARASGAVRGVERFDLERSAKAQGVAGPPPGWGQTRLEEEERADGTWMRRLTGAEPPRDGAWISPDETEAERKDRETDDMRKEQARAVEAMRNLGWKKDEMMGFDEPERFEGPLD